MALDLLARYPGQLAATDPAGYPYGKAQNVTTEGDGTGTPFEADLLNDILGMHQALLSAAGITPSGTPDKVGASQYLLSFYQLLGRAEGWGAIGNDSADDTGPLQAALDALALRTGRQELHLATGKTYRVEGLQVPTNVDLILHGAVLKIDHPTNALLEYAGTVVNNPVPQRIVGGVFSAVGANTGATILFSENGSFVVADCYFGESANATGKFIEVTGTVNVTANGNHFSGVGDTPHIDFSGFGDLRLENNKHYIPVTYSSSCVKVGATLAWINRCTFYLTAHTTGSMSCIEITGAGKVHLSDNEFYNNTDATLPVAIKWGAIAAWIFERGSDFIGDVTPYSGTVVLAEGSSLELRPHGQEVSADVTYVFQDDYRAFSLSGNFATLPIDFKMPKKRFPGQTFDVILLNSHNTTDWQDSAGVTMDALGSNMSDLDPSQQTPNGFMKTARFMVARDHNAAAWAWVMVGGWSPRFVQNHTVGA